MKWIVEGLLDAANVGERQIDTRQKRQTETHRERERDRGEVCRTAARLDGWKRRFRKGGGRMQQTRAPSLHTHTCSHTHTCYTTQTWSRKAGGWIAAGGLSYSYSHNSSTTGESG